MMYLCNVRYRHMCYTCMYRLTEREGSHSTYTCTMQTDRQTHTHEHTCIHTHTHTCTQSHACMHTHTHTHTHTHAYIHTHIHTHTHVHTHACIHAHTHTHKQHTTHTQKEQLNASKPRPQVINVVKMCIEISVFHHYQYVQLWLCDCKYEFVCDITT